MTHPSIGIIGVGMVGGAMYAYYPNALVYDPIRYPNTKEQIKQADIFFVCVPTPHVPGIGCDTSIVEEVMRWIPEGKTVVIRSTVIPGTTDRLQKAFPHHRMLFNPEFLDELTAVENFKNPNRQIIGFTPESKSVANDVLAMLPSAPYRTIMPAMAAETVKYFGNSFYASKVVFANQIYDLCQKIEVNYDTIREAVAADPRIGPSHLMVWHKGYRGYGGKCLPKDTKALIHFAREHGVPLRALEMVDSINDEITSNTRREETIVAEAVLSSHRNHVMFQTTTTTSPIT